MHSRDAAAVAVDPLFRREPTEYRSRLRIFSDPVSAQPRSRMIVAWIMFFVLASTLVFLGTVSYTKTIIAYGQLSTRKGITRVRSFQKGIVAAIHVKEGDFVSAGTTLFETSADRAGDGGSLRTEVTRELMGRLDTISSELDDTRSLNRMATSELRSKISWLRTDIAKQRAEMQEMERAVSLCEELVRRAEAAFTRHLIAREAVDARNLDLADRKAKYISAQRQLDRSNYDLILAGGELTRSQHQGRLSEAPISQRASAIRQELSELASQTSELILAPHDGIVTSIVTSVGQTIEAGTALSMLSHRDDSSIIHIYVPGSAIAHIKPEDTVVLEFESVDARNLGKARAVIESVSSFPMTGHELSQIAGGLPHIEERAVNELLFDVIARPQIQAGRAPNPLLMRQKGVTVRAILPLKSRKLYEWIVDPLRMAKERQQAHASG